MKTVMSGPLMIILCTCSCIYAAAQTKVHGSVYEVGAGVFPGMQALKYLLHIGITLADISMQVLLFHICTPTEGKPKPQKAVMSAGVYPSTS